MNTGIDYGNGTTNIDKDTSIRYGVIAMGTICQAWCDSAEPDYGLPTCGECCAEVLDLSMDKIDYCPFCGKEKHNPESGICQFCNEDFDTSDLDSIVYCPICGKENRYADWYSDEPNMWNLQEDLDAGELIAESSGDSPDVWCIKSPFYTLTRLCSPCAPGAGDLNSPMEDGCKTYCFPHDFFDGDCAPYPVYKVSDNSLR